jgi:hypothetical protein
MTPCPAVIFSGTKNATNTAARKAMRCAVNGAHSRIHVTHITKDNTINYTSSQSDCATCPIKTRCRPNTPALHQIKPLFVIAGKHMI